MNACPRSIPDQRGTVFPVLAACAALLAVGAVPAFGQEGAEGKLTGTPEALIRLERPAGWSVGAAVRFDRRSFEADDGAVFALDIDYAIARAGYAPLPFVQIWGEAGAGRAEDEAANEKADAGPAWGIGATARLLEYVLRTSPVTGDRETLGLVGEVAYRGVESDFSDEQAFDYNEFTILPAVEYARSFEGDWERHRRSLREILVRGGVLFSSLDGTFGEADIEGDSEFAVHFGIATRWAGGWVAEVRGDFYGSSDRSIGIGVGYHF